MTRRTEPPRQRGSATSTAAAAAIVEEASRLQRRVYRFIRRRGARGCTDEEGDEKLGLGGSTYRPRRVELVAMGCVRDSGTKRRTTSGRLATVWVAV